MDHHREVLPWRVRVLRALTLGCALALAGCSAEPVDDDEGEEETDTDESGVGAAAVKVFYEDPNAIGIRNGDGDWWIAKRCLGASQFGPGKTTGPGYVFQLLSPVHGGKKLMVVDDKAGPSHLPWGGLLSFAYHHARGNPPFSLQFGGTGEVPGNAWSIGTRTCADDGGNGFGVARATVMEGPTKYGGGPTAPLYWSIYVELKTPWRDPTVGILYRYQFHSSVVKVWTRVWNKCAGPTCGDIEGVQNFAKEPKFMALVEKGFFDEFASIDNSGNVLAKFGMTNAVFKTNQHSSDLRSRMRFGYSWTKCNDTHRCLNIKARSYPAGAEPGQPTRRWENYGLGLDRWAGLAALDPVSPLAVDSPAGVGNAQPWACHGGNPNAQLMRRWESGGQNGANAPIAPFVFFHGWEGGASVDDCEPLYRHFPPAEEEFANFFSLDVSP